MTVIPVLWIGYSKLEVLCLHPSSIAFSLAVSSPGPAIQYIPDQTKRIQKFVRDAAPSLFFWIGDPKQNVNSFMTPFSDSVFYSLSHGSLGFVLHGSSLNRHCKDSYWLLKKINQSKNGWESYHGEQNQGYHVKENKKLIHKHVSKMTLHFVWIQLSKKQTVGSGIQCIISECGQLLISFQYSIMVSQAWFAWWSIAMAFGMPKANDHFDSFFLHIQCRVRYGIRHMANRANGDCWFFYYFLPCHSLLPIPFTLGKHRKTYRRRFIFMIFHDSMNPVLKVPLYCVDQFCSYLTRR